MDENFVLKKSTLKTYGLETLLIISLAFSFIVVRVAYTSFRSSQQNELKLLADNIVLDHEGSIFGIKQFLISSGYLAEESGSSNTSCSMLLQKISVEYPYFLNIGMTDKNGNLICSGVPVPDGVDASLANDQDFLEASQTNEFSVSGYRISTITGRPSVRFLQPIIRKNIFDGVLFVTFATDWLNGFATSFNPPDGTVVEKFDDTGTVFMRYPDPLTWSGTNQGESDFFKTVKEKTRGFVTTDGLDGIQRLYYFEPIYFDGNIQAYTVVGTDRNKLRSLFGL